MNPARLPQFLSLLVSAAFCGQALPARDAYVVLSGGGSPLSNNYSQYVQAKNLSEYFRARYPADSVWVFFGAGNVTGQPAKLADAYKKLKRDNGKGGQVLIDSWQPGFLPNNHPATREAFFKALKEEILPAVHDGGTLFLFVGDHGEQTRTPPYESQITLWQMKPTGGEHGWTQDPKEELPLTDLRKELAAGIGKGKVVFCMTQCHSGGFNFLGVERVPAVPAGWFSAPTKLPTSTPPLLMAAGFTATDENSLAAGCDPDPDPDKWAGYERFIPEHLIGKDLLRGTRLNAGLPSFAAANDAAVVVDRTIDKPRSTSEQYLETWATLIETKLAKDPTLSPDIKAKLAVYDRVMNGNPPLGATDRAFKEQWDQFHRFTVELAKQNLGTADLILDGTAKQLDEAMGPQARPGGTPPGGGPGRGGNRGGGASFSEYSKLWTETLRPAWKAALDAGEVKGPAAAIAFEKKAIASEESSTGRDLTVNPRGILNFEFWNSGFAFPDKTDEAKAEEVTLWVAQRRAHIIEWAEASADEKIRKAGEEFGSRRAGFTGFGGRGGNGRGGGSQINKIAVERVRFYRRVMAAWAFLLATKDRDALAQLKVWRQLESTPLPPPMVAAVD
jgi:hypothetical protein